MKPHDKQQLSAINFNYGSHIYSHQSRTQNLGQTPTEEYEMVPFEVSGQERNGNTTLPGWGEESVQITFSKIVSPAQIYIQLIECTRSGF